MFDELADRAVLLGLRIGVETEEAVAVLDARVQRAAVRAEAQTQQVAVVGRVAHQEGAVGLVGQLALGLAARHPTPVPAEFHQFKQLPGQVRVAAAAAAADGGRGAAGRRLGLADFGRFLLGLVH